MLRKLNKSYPVNISSKLRKDHRWFEKALEPIKNKLLSDKRKELALTGPKLTPRELVKIADELEEIQRELNPLLIRHKELSDQIAAHFGHTGIKEIIGNLGRTEISTPYIIKVDPKIIEKEMPEEMAAMTERRLVPERMLLHLQRNWDVLSAAFLKAIMGRVSIYITLPSSQRPESGRTFDEEEETAA
ncbi:hypothetical protein HYW53_02320 [Candidatus Giovannonibacteria bacterium]|nr:hypothetical protein [Candidatus Giovannonibacteria bacterium]